MTRQQRGTGYVAALVARLGGDVVITDEEARRAGDLQIDYDPQRLQTRISLKPVELVGEIVTAELQSIEPPRCRHPFKVLHWTFEGDMLCGDCGARVGHDEDMRIRLNNSGLI